MKCQILEIIIFIKWGTDNIIYCEKQQQVYTVLLDQEQIKNPTKLWLKNIQL